MNVHIKTHIFLKDEKPQLHKFSQSCSVPEVADQSVVTSNVIPQSAAMPDVANQSDLTGSTENTASLTSIINTTDSIDTCDDRCCSLLSISSCHKSLTCTVQWTRHKQII